LGKVSSWYAYSIEILIELTYDPLLSHCFEGLMETEHPYAFVAFQALKEMLQADVIHFDIEIQKIKFLK